MFGAVGKKFGEKKIYLVIVLVYVVAIFYSNSQYNKIKEKLTREIASSPEILAEFIVHSENLDKFTKPFSINLSNVINDEMGEFVNLTPVGTMHTNSNLSIQISLVNLSNELLKHNAHLDKFYELKPEISTIEYFHKISENKYLNVCIIDDKSFLSLNEIKSENKQNFFFITLYFVGIFLVFVHFEVQKNALKYDQEKIKNISTKAKYDKLTNAINRIGIDETLEYHINLFSKFGIKFSVIFFDIDFFKRFNDDFGHEVGDEVLIKLSQFVQRNCRTGDVLGRWGGEEFILILPSTSLGGAINLANKLQQDIQNTRLIDKRQVTCSFGVVEISAHEDKTALMKRVDTLLYQAKESGRNCVKF